MLSYAHGYRLEAAPEVSRMVAQAYCTVADAARELHVSPSTVWRWIDAGKLRAYRAGEHTIRIKREDLERVLRPVRPTQVSSTESTMRPRRTATPPEQLERRKQLVARILKLREQANIAPLTAAELVRQVRDEELASYEPPR